MATETTATERPAESSDRDVPEEVLTEIGAALFHLRRIWAKPDLMKRVRAQTAAGPDGRPLQLSNLMVVNAVAGLLATAGKETEDDGPEITVGAVADRLEVDPSTASRLVGHAIDAGLVSRRPSPIDARRANLGLTDAGTRVKQVADRFRRSYYNELMSGWTDEERAEFGRLLTRFADAAAAQAPLYPDDGIGRIFEEAGAD
ncbi:MarR family winged helix-turn-helix transcriptional regulator [Actinomadura algeriensis]|uniref:DNA-binding MarR family transcriptional regulator n=1 Tax=Actinomadura algeriensis TaxID=1679523 RepID=A0ABR9JSI1_9ACTN|nr:MarR family transcriptional regulator [Actinomadura algeriensis]MBE1533507.1 DNA-binding MarR family transcriptional regulator [Actinomadura algeriensis]